MEKNIINPCQSCFSILGSQGKLDINNLNNCCNQTCADWFGDNLEYQNACVVNCRDCVKPFIDATGRSNYRVVETVSWHDTPSYFPSLYLANGGKDSGDAVEKGFQGCLEMCQTTARKEECMKKCEIDKNALVFANNNIKAENCGKVKAIIPSEIQSKMGIEWFFVVLFIGIVVCGIMVGSKKKRGSKFPF